jgi:transposase
VYTVHDWAEVRRLHGREHLSKKHIAERLGMSRTTVHRLLELTEPPHYERPRRPCLLDAHMDSVKSMLTEDPAAPATVILQHLRREGYGGGVSILKDLLTELRPLYGRGPDPFQRTTYIPGEICQLDWWDVPARFVVPVGHGHIRPAFGLVGVLPYSAVHAVVFTHTKTVADVVAALPGVLTRLAGLPRSLVVDRDSSIVVPRTRRVHDQLASVLGQLAIRPIVLPPRKPTSKGAVERTNGYLETSFLPLRCFTSLLDLQAQHDEWAATVAWRRNHRRVGVRPEVAHRTERDALASLPDIWPDTSTKTCVRASRDCFVRVAGADYSVPPPFVSRMLDVKITLSEIVVACEGREIVRHARSFVPADVVVAPGHAQELAHAKRARAALRAGDVVVPDVDLSVYDALCGVV